MSLHLAAQHLQSQGRGDDDHLVHMTTGELQSLQKLAKQHGGSLTINPKTGLPEAGFLSAVLPMALGAVGGAFLPEMLAGTALEGSAGLVSAGLIGAADYALTGSLGQGIMAGFGAYSGANLEQSIANYGAAGDQAAANITSSTTPPPTPTTNTIAPDTSTTLTPDAQPQVAPNYNVNAQGYPSSAPVGTTPTETGGGGYKTPIARQSFTTGLQNVANAPGDFFKKNWMPVASVGVPLALAAAKANQPTPYTLSSPSIPNPLKLNSPNFQASIPAQPTPPYQAQYTNYVANPYTAKQGGLMDVKKYSRAGEIYDDVKMAQEGIQSLDNYYKASKDPLDTPHNMALAIAKPDAGIYSLSNAEYSKSDPLSIAQANHIKLVKGIQPGVLGGYNPYSVLDQADKTSQQDIASSAPSSSVPYASAKGGQLPGGLSLHGSDLGSYSDGGHLLKGPGDGVSDSIPATIGGHQPARLAEGEFVIPARIVSELGNGSTDAGAKRLYEMMDRIKAKRAKAKDIAADTKAYKFLPA